MEIWSFTEPFKRLKCTTRCWTLCFPNQRITTRKNLPSSITPKLFSLLPLMADVLQVILALIWGSPFPPNLSAFLLEGSGALVNSFHTMQHNAWRARGMITKCDILYKCIGAKATIATDKGRGRYGVIFNSLLWVRRGGGDTVQLLDLSRLWH